MFCQSCGAQVTGAFCTKCGARATQPPPPPVQPGGPPPSYSAPPPPPVQPGGPPPSYSAPPPPPPPPPPQQQYAPPQQQYAPPPQQYAPQQALPPASSGSGIKILFIVLGILAFLGMLGVGALWYGWHMVKQTAAAKGVDLDSITETHHGPVRRLDACELLPKEELAQLVGMNIERTEGKGKSSHSTCAYYSSGAIDKSSDAATDAIKRIQERKDTGDTNADQEKALKDVGSIVRGISGVAANGLVVSVEVDTENAKAAMAGFKIAMGVMTVGGDKNHALREDIKGLGDEAIMGPLASIFMFRKGDVAVMIDGRALTGGRDAQVAIAKRIADKL